MMQTENFLLPVIVLVISYINIKYIFYEFNFVFNNKWDYRQKTATVP